MAQAASKLGRIWVKAIREWSIDGNMNVFPTAVKHATAATIGTRNHTGEAAQLLNIEVEQIARGRVLIANQGNSRFQIARLRFRPRRRRMRLTVARLSPVV